jgi:hypothetical protein
MTMPTERTSAKMWVRINFQLLQLHKLNSNKLGIQKYGEPRVEPDKGKDAQAKAST